MKLVQLFFFFAFGGILPLSAQNATIQGTNAERAQLEKLVKEKIDSVRIKHKRTTLAINEVLYKAAAHHSDYIKDKNKLSHTETTKGLKTPQERADYFGAQRLLVGENVMFTDYNISITTTKGKKYKPNNLETLANLIVQIWIDSPSHFKNMMVKEYTLTAVAISFDTSKNRVFATQLFAYIGE